jgi:TPR repeat protein
MCSRRTQTVKKIRDRRLTGGLVLTAVGVLFTTIALAAFLPSNSIVISVRRGDCAAAVKLINPDVKSNDAETAFLAGRLLDERVCVHQDPVAAAHYFARAAELGNRDAALDFAAKVGLGEGTEQDYQRAGELCRAAGVDPQSRLSSYSLRLCVHFAPHSRQAAAKSPTAGGFQTHGRGCRRARIHAGERANART